MEGFFDMFLVFYEGLLYTLNEFSFNLYGLNVSLLDILIGALILSFAASFLWKGARG